MPRRRLAGQTTTSAVAIVSAQELQRVFMGYNRSDKKGVANFGFSKADRAVTVFYFYIVDADFGAGFIKIAT